MIESKTLKEGPQPLLGKERAEILLHEYDNLRIEIIHRTNNFYQVITIAALVLGWWFLRSREFEAKHVVVLFGGAVILAYFFGVIARDIGKAADRIAEIEAFVDRETGDWYLLRWERLWGGRKTGYWLRARPLPVPTRPNSPEGQ